MAPKSSSNRKRSSNQSQDNVAAPASSTPVMIPSTPITPTPVAAAVIPTVSGDTIEPARTQPMPIASVQVLAPPADSESHPIPYGRLNSHDASFFIQATPLQLKTIIATAPAHLRTTLPANATKDDLLNELFKLRQHEAVQNQPKPPSAADILTKLMTMTCEEVFQFAETNSDELKQMMHTALQADSTLYPRNFPLSDNGALAATVITWQFNAYKNAHPMVNQNTRRVRFQTPPGPAPQDPQSSTPVTPAAPTHTFANLANLLDPAQNVPHQSEDSSDDFDTNDTRSARQQTYITPQGFTYGAGSAIPQLLHTYPGKDFSSRSLNVKELRGPKVLCNWIASGIDIPTFLFHFKWKRSAGGFPSQAEMEAHTLGRIIHLEMLTCPSPKTALETRPSLEVALRRPYAILFVEESLASGIYTDKGLAWSNVEFLLESHPNSTVMCDEISDHVIKRIALEKKRLAAVKAMESHELPIVAGSTGRRATTQQPQPGRPHTAAKQG